MKWDDFVNTVKDLPVIEVDNLLGGDILPDDIRVQLSRWQRAGKVLQLRRGIYLLSSAYRKIEVYEPYLAACLKRPSYISLEKALEFHNLIPEAVSVFTSITTKRAVVFKNELGVFDYRHIKNTLFWGYDSVTVNKQTGYMACPEKALLDLIYLRQVKVNRAYLEELRLENVEKINLDKLLEMADKFKKPKLIKAAKVIKKYIILSKNQEKVL